jgi:hypothetical protein
MNTTQNSTKRNFQGLPYVSNDPNLPNNAKRRRIVQAGGQVYRFEKRKNRLNMALQKARDLMERGITDQSGTFIRRNPAKYTSNQLLEISAQSDLIKAGFNLLRVKTKQTFYPNQEGCSAKILANIRNIEKVYTLIVAKCQSGKTGTMACLIRDIVADSNVQIPLENIFIFASISDNAWLEQTKRDFPTCLHSQIFHRGNLAHFASAIVDEYGKLKRNILICIDEAHAASKTDQTVSKLFAKFGLDNPEILCEHDVKIVEFTATPNGLAYDIAKWNDSHLNRAELITMAPGYTYVGAKQLKYQQRVRQFRDLLCAKWSRQREEWDIDAVKGAENAENLIATIQLKYTQPMYHIIRVHTKSGAADITRSHLQCAANKVGCLVVFKNFNSFTKDDVFFEPSDIAKKHRNIDFLLTQPPQQHTIIFVKELLRCAKNIRHKTWLGVLYERKSKSISDSVIEQGLLGRCGGYNDNGMSMIYTNLKSIDKYEQMWDSQFKDIHVLWKSLTTKQTRRRRNRPQTTYSSGTIALPANTTAYRPDPNEGYNAKVCDSWSELVAFFDQKQRSGLQITGNVHSIGPRARSVSVNGFYEAARLMNRSAGPEIISVQDAVNRRGMGISESGFRVWPGYTDRTDPNTLKWVLCWRCQTPANSLVSKN